jgi:hypothetical protein
MLKVDHVRRAKQLATAVEEANGVRTRLAARGEFTRSFPLALAPSNSSSATCSTPVIPMI